MKCYLAARYSLYPSMQGYASQLEQAGIQVVSRWIRGDHDIRSQGASESATYLPLWAREDLDDLLSADLCIAFGEPPTGGPGRARGGRHVEFGLALAVGKRLVLVGYRENVFHWLPQVEFFATWGEAFEAVTEAPPADRERPAHDRVWDTALPQGATL